MKQEILLISSNTIGRGNDELGAILMKSYLSTLIDNHNFSIVIFINSGVKLLIEPSLVDDLKDISKKATLLACGTCLDFYNIGDKMLVGGRSSMPILSKLISDATKVVSL